MKFSVSLVVGLFVSLPAFADKPFSNLDSLKSSLGFSEYYETERDVRSRKLKIAVLDKGFTGYKNEIGRTLPKNTRYVAGPVASPADLKVEHGLRMAQILTAFMTDDMEANQWAPELTLYNVFGYSNLKSAIDEIIANKVDLVLYSEVWEYGGNFDGTGFINEQINRATKNGVIWVNAAGNFGLTTYNSKIETLDESWVRLPDQNNALTIRCDAKKGGKCPIKIVLSWNDFKNDVNLGTKKDLDLALTDDLLNILQSSALKQTTEDADDRPGYSKYPREIIQAEVKAGTYYIRVKNRSNNFKDRDQLRITVDGENLSMPSHSTDENLLNPADNTSVITVGASDSDRSSTSRRLGKPDITAPSAIEISDGGEYRGSSNSAAIVAAGLGLLKSSKPKWTRKDLLKAVTQGQGSGSYGRGLSLQDLGFRPTGHNCFQPAMIEVPPYLYEAIRNGGDLVLTTASVRVLVPFDPIRLAPYLRRQSANDMVVALPQGGYGVFQRYGYIVPGAVEIFQAPQEAGLCTPSNRGSYSGTSGSFRLPYVKSGTSKQPDEPDQPDTPGKPEPL
ncbi:Subtilase family protein [compost metagenome]